MVTRSDAARDILRDDVELDAYASIPVSDNIQIFRASRRQVSSAIDHRRNRRVATAAFMAIHRKTSMRYHEVIFCYSLR